MKKNGFIAFTSTLVLSAVILFFSATAGMLAIGEGQSARSWEKGEDALAFVEGCMEDAMIKARRSANYNGGNITRPEGTCSIAVTKSGNDWTLRAIGSNRSHQRTIETRITRTGSGLILTLWQEI